MHLPQQQLLLSQVDPGAPGAVAVAMPCMHAHQRLEAPSSLALYTLQRAKDLHPDLNAQWSASDSEAFLRLVTAYEVLSDPQQRQLYDMSASTELPGVLRRAAAAGAEPHAKAEQQAADGKGGHSR